MSENVRVPFSTCVSNANGCVSAGFQRTENTQVLRSELEIKDEGHDSISAIHKYSSSFYFSVPLS